MKEKLIRGCILCCLLIAVVLMSAATPVNENKNCSTTANNELIGSSPTDLVENRVSYEYYAYMNLDEANAETQKIILQARNAIIFSETWTADGIKGRIVNPDGSYTEVPEFHDIFPKDWDIPVVSTKTKK